VDVYAGRAPLPVIDIAVDYVNERLGTDLPIGDVVGMLTGLGFDVRVPDREAPGQLRVLVPGWRATKDVSIPEDLVEEVGRLFGYDNIAPQRPSALLPQPYRHPGRTFHRRVRTALSLAGGLHELQLYSFSSEAVLDKVGRTGHPRIGMRNPISTDMTHLRTHLSPGVLGAVERNRNEVPAFVAYEIGRVYHPHAGGIPHQPYRLSVVTWRRKGTTYAADQGEALAHLKDLVEGLALRLSVDVTYRRANAPLPWLHPARTAEIVLTDGIVLGQVGALHPSAGDALDLGGWCAIAELDLDVLQAARPSRPTYEVIARFPSVPTDISLLVGVPVTHSEVDATLRAAAPDTVRGIELVADFRGAPIPDGHKSLTYRLHFQSKTGTLTTEEVQAATTRMVEAAAAAHGASMRG